ncbi:hypothetical protein WOLCODRAFT_166027 [Wolfiporia cocos MD-104 SS10]|uniref:Uncharacterized protein n=1 Tax=Wolfiporia cocos (strain MD-104) TaxID=742152 RepID=A0A2H3J057_WOLCO|nr:hypothetical protein WOLCODRAFT_166027 [Wolfiporia cocos MD-104 SS10]
MAISREDGSGRLRAAVEDLFKQLKHYQVDHALLQQTHTEAIAELAWLRTLVCCPTLEVTRRTFLLRAERSRERMEREYPEEYSQVTLGDVSRVIAELRAAWSQAPGQRSAAPFGIFDEFSLLSGGIQYLKEQLMAAPPTPVRLGKAHTGEGESSERGTPRRRLDDE